MGKTVATKIDRAIQSVTRNLLAICVTAVFCVMVAMPVLARAAGESLMHTSVNLGTKYGVWGGAFTCLTCHQEGFSPNVKKVAAVVQTPTGPRPVIFLQMTAASSDTQGVLGNDLRTYAQNGSTNICEVCHHQTLYHQYSSSKAQAGHYDNKLCTSCHWHSDGFKASGHTVPYYAAASHGGHPTCSTAIGCHTNTNPAASYPDSGSAPDCRSCHLLADPNEVDNEIDKNKINGCGSCHGAPGGLGEPSGEVYPNRAGSHEVHTVVTGEICTGCHSSGGTGGNADHGMGNRGANPAIVNIDPFFGWSSAVSKKTCSSTTCHVSPYSSAKIKTPSWGTPVGCAACHNANTMPFQANGAPATGSHNKHMDISGTGCNDCHDGVNHLDGSVSVTSGYPGTAKHTANTGYTGTCSSASCHSDPYGPNPIETPVWGTPAGCASCHKDGGLFQGNGAPATGSHESHMKIFGADCGQCHAGAQKGVSGGTDHAKGTVNVMHGYSSGTSVGKHAAPPLGQTTGYSYCGNASCHASPYSSDNLETPRWGSLSGCASCHMNEGAFAAPIGGAPYTGSHEKHMLQGATCGQCHSGAVTVLSGASASGGTHHPNSFVNVTSGYTASPVAKHSAGSAYSGFCTNAACHNDGNGNQMNSPVWGHLDNDCISCHGGDALTVSPIATFKHRTHINNYSTLGQNNNLDCAACHAKTVSSGNNRLVTTPANHFNAIKNYSGTRAGGSANYDLALKVCSNVYCHSSGQAMPIYRSMTGSKAWGGPAKLDCSGCHGNEAGASWTTTLGAPNYRNNSTSNANSHQRHVSSMTDTKKCANCHTSTVSATVANRLKDSSPSHLNKNRDVSFAAYGVYSSATKSCTTYCHSNVQKPGGVGAATFYAKPKWGFDNSTMTCSSCHANMSTLAESPAGLALGSHRRHAVMNNTTSGTGGAGYDCSICHGNGYSATAVNGDKHVNQRINVNFTGKGSRSTYSQFSSSLPGNNYGTCTSNCHGRASRNWGISTTKPTCEKCHGSARTAQELDEFKDTTITSEAFAGKHLSHLKPLYSSPVACNNCHTVPTDIYSFGHMSSISPSIVKFSGMASFSGNRRMTPSYTGGVQTCSNTYCHAGVPVESQGGGITPGWKENGYLGCGKCHGNPPVAPHIIVSPGTCKACHNHTSSTGDGFDDKSLHVNGIVETTADDCLTCHRDYCPPEATDCIAVPLHGGHNTHTDVSYFLEGKKLSKGDYIDPSWIYSIKFKKGFPQFACGFCHLMDSAKHKNHVTDLDMDPAHSQLGTVKTKSKPYYANYSTNWYSPWITTYQPGTFAGTTFTPGTVVCNNVYCHGNGYVSPQTNTYAYQRTPDWYYADKNGNQSAWANVDRCAQCHGNSPNTDTGFGMRAGSDAHGRHVVANHYNDVFNGYSGKVKVAGASGNRVHGNAAVATTFNCNICHYATVRTANNDKGSTCNSCHNGSTASFRGAMGIYSSGNTHVNGIPDINFMTPFSVRSKAQVRDSLRSVQGLYTSWTRVQGYKSYSTSHDLSRQIPEYVNGSCSTVTCHNGTPMEWRTKGPLSCSACHTALPQ